MSVPPADSDEYMRFKIETILSARSKDDEQTAMDELFRHLVENPRPVSANLKCAFAIDSNNDAIVDIVGHMLPTEWRPFITVAGYDRFSDVIRMVRDARPALLVIHSNLLLLSVRNAIAGCVAVSPNTRYLIMTTWSAESVEQFTREYQALHISLGTLSTPFSRDELLATLSSECQIRLEGETDGDKTQ
jgi:hypothetical protein